MTGKQPPIYTNVSSYQTGTLADGWTNGVQTIYAGADGVYHQATKGNPAIKPERTSGLDVGGDLAFLNGRLTVGVTYYTEDTKDVILRTKSAADNAIPAGNGIMVEVLASLYHLTGEDRFRAEAEALAAAVHAHTAAHHPHAAHSVIALSSVAPMPHSHHPHAMAAAHSMAGRFRLIFSAMTHTLATMIAVSMKYFH